MNPPASSLSLMGKEHSLRKQNLDDSLTDGLQSRLVNVSHVISKRMPGGTKGTLLAIRIVRDDIYTGNMCNGIDGYMVVGYISARLLRESAAKADGLRSAPHTVDNGRGVLHGHTLAIELCTLSANHIKEDTETGSIAWLMEVRCPIL